LNTAKIRNLVLVVLSGCIVITITSAGILQAQEPQAIDRIVAVVNSEIVTLYDLNRAFRPFAENIKALRYAPEKERQTLFQVRKDILDQLINSMLADQEVKRDRITVSEKEIDTTIERMKVARSLTDEQLREGLAGQGLTMEEYRKEIKEQVLRTKLVNREVKSKIVITKEDIAAYYSSHQDKYAGDRKYYLWNIFVKLSSTTNLSEKKAAQEQLDTIEAELHQGQSFESLVNELRDSDSAVQGTDLGLYRLEELSEQFQKVVREMKPGEFSAVLNTDFGYQILYVQKIQETPAKPLDKVESEIHQELYTEFVNNKYQEWLDELRARSLIKIIN